MYSMMSLKWLVFVFFLFQATSDFKYEFNRASASHGNICWLLLGLKRVYVVIEISA